MQRSPKTRTLRTVKVAMSGFLSAVLALYMPIVAYAGTYDIRYGDITITATDDSHSVDYYDSEGSKNTTDPSPTVTGTSDANIVTIHADEGKTADVTFEDLNIDRSGNTDEAAVTVEGSGDVNIELDGTNTLKSGNRHAGLEKTSTGNLTIQDADNTGSAAGSLTATGGTLGAGIGGGPLGSGNGITISGGTVKATGENGGAGIGGGSQGSGSGITISGGSVEATSEARGAGIGGGNQGSGNGITISGGTVKATGGYDGGAGIGGGYQGSGSDITISGSAVVKVAGGSSHISGAGAAIGSGGQNHRAGTPVEPDISELYTTGSITQYEPGTTLEQITNGTVQPMDGYPKTGTVVPPADPVEPDPNNNDPVKADSVISVPVNPTLETADNTLTIQDSTQTNASTAPESPVTSQDSDEAFNAAVDIQIDNLLKPLYSLLEAGKLDEANALIARGLVINGGTHKGFNAATLAKLGELSRAGIAVTIVFTYEGVNYSVTIPGNSQINPASLVDESGYCGFLNLKNFFG